MNIRKFLLFVSLSWVSLITYSQTINTKLSVVKFKTHAMGMLSIKGTFSGFSGNVTFNSTQPSQSKIDVCIKSTTFKTGNDKRDEHVQSKDFLNVKKYPNICFSSSSITKTSNGFLAKGTLKLHGISKTVAIPLTYHNKIVHGAFELQRLDYNIGKDVGTFKASATVEIEINCVMN